MEQWELCSTSPSLPAPVQEEALLPPQHNEGVGRGLTLTFVSQDASGVPSDAWPEGGDWGHRELSLGWHLSTPTACTGCAVASVTLTGPADVGLFICTWEL